MSVHHLPYRGPYRPQPEPPRKHYFGLVLVAIIVVVGIAGGAKPLSDLIDREVGEWAAQTPTEACDFTTQC